MKIINKIRTGFFMLLCLKNELFDFLLYDIIKARDRNISVSKQSTIIKHIKDTINRRSILRFIVCFNFNYFRLKFLLFKQRLHLFNEPGNPWTLFWIENGQTLVSVQVHICAILAKTSATNALIKMWHQNIRLLVHILESVNRKIW